MSLTILKEGNKNFQHQDADYDDYGANDITIIFDGNFVKLRSVSGRIIFDKDGYLFSDVTIIDNSTSGSPEVYPSIVQLKQRLINLGYPFEGGATIVPDGVASIVAGANITVDATDPQNPVVTGENGGVQSVVAGTNITVDNTDPDNPIVSSVAGGTGTVTSVAISTSDGIEVDSGSPVTTSGTIALGLNKVSTLAFLNVEDGADVTDATNVNAAGAVMESDYDANTILSANVDNTPLPLTVAEQTLVGRITGGNVAGLTVTQIKTLLNYLEEQISGTATYDATVTGATNIDLNNDACSRLILTGNATLTFTNTPASGFSVVRSYLISSTATETLGIANSDNEYGAYVAATTVTKMVVEASNYPTAGLIIDVFFSQPN